MSARGEQGLMQHLVDTASMRTVVQTGLDFELIPTKELHPVYQFALDYYMSNGCQFAPTSSLVREHYADVLDDMGIDIEVEPEDTIEWVLVDLRGSYVYKQSEIFAKAMSKAVAESPPQDRVSVIGEAATELVRISLAVENRAFRTDMRVGVDVALREYDDRSRDKLDIRGMRFGFPELDAHIYGVHPGELAIWGSGPKGSKSYLQAFVALANWELGDVPVLFTLENSVPMTMDRIACMAAGVKSSDWQRGVCTDDEVEEIRAWAATMRDSNHPLWILQPDMGQRSVEHLVREAQVREADALLIDQLTFVEHDQEIRAKDQQIAASLHRLKTMISVGRKPIPCLLTTQINREGVKFADKVGYHEMWHFAEAAEIERTADFALSSYQTRDMRTYGEYLWQILGARRTANAAWGVQWAPHVSNIRPTCNKVIDDIERENAKQ